MINFDSLSIREVSRHFGRRRALNRVSFECASGQIAGLLGPNGAGKSTLLSIISTLAAPSSGVVSYGGRTAAEWGPAIRAAIGVLSHDLHLYSELTARENLRFFAAMYGESSQVPIDRALERAGLSDRGGDLVQGFSRGMRQRLALERALIHQPRLLLLDEPFTGLDEASTRALIARLRELRAAGHIMLVATHDFDTAEMILDQAVMLRDGRVCGVETDVSGLRQRYRASMEQPA